MPEDIPLEALLKDAIRSQIARVHTSAPARVIDYDSETCTAKVQLILQQSYIDAESGERVYYEVPPLVEVPVVFPAILTWPLSKGDPGWVMFSERSLDEYVAEGGGSVRPVDARRFDLSDAVFYPTYMRGEFDSDGSAAVLAADKLKIRGTSGGQTRPVAIAPEVEDFLRDFILQEMNLHIHTDPLTGTTGPIATPATPPSPGQFDSSNTEAE